MDTHKKNKFKKYLISNAIWIIGWPLALFTFILNWVIPFSFTANVFFLTIILAFFGGLYLYKNEITLKGITIDNIRTLQLKHIKKIDFLLYFLLFDLVCLSMKFLYYSLYTPGNFKTIQNLSSNSDFLTSIVQSEAAIIAIVISLTFVAVTLTVDKYSFRTNEIFKKIFPDTWILLSIYSITIIYGLFLLNGHIIPFNDDLFFITSLAVYSLICLFLYSWNVLSILRPENIAAIYSYKIDLKYKPFKPDLLRKEDLSDDESGYILAIFDIMKNSIKKDDPNAVYATITYLTTLVERILDGYPATVECPDLRLKYISSLMKKTKIDHDKDIEKMFKNYSPDINRYVDIMEGIKKILDADKRKIPPHQGLNFLFNHHYSIRELYE